MPVLVPPAPQNKSAAKMVRFIRGRRGIFDRINRMHRMITELAEGLAQAPAFVETALGVTSEKEGDKERQNGHYTKDVEGDDHGSA